MTMPFLSLFQLSPRLRRTLSGCALVPGAPRCLLAYAAASVVLGSGVANAASRPGAARSLAIVPLAGAGSAIENAATWSSQARAFNLAPGISWAGPGLAAGTAGVSFVREDAQGSGVWVALPRPEAQAARAGDSAWSGRGARWSARPVLRVRAPLQFSTPLPVDGGRLLLLSTNAASLDGAAVLATPQAEAVRRDDRRGRWRVAWVEPQSGRWGFLSPPDADSYDPSLSPDGKRLAFTSMRGDRESVQTLNLGRGLSDLTAPGRPTEREPWRSGLLRQAAASARGARWMDASTLIFESTSTRVARERTSLGLYVLPVRADGTPGEPRLLLPRAREVAVAPNGRSLCAVVSASESPEETSPAPTSGRASRRADDDSQSTLLVMMAPDGSGQRWLQDTRGARRPSFVDSRAILFDAPAQSEATSASAQPAANAARALWSVPLLRTPPVATLSNVAPLQSLPQSIVLASGAGATDDGALAVVGTAFSPEWGPLSARVEVGQGESPTQWSLLAERNSAAQNEIVARWKPPANARGDWTLRLKVRDAAGDEAQSLLPVTLPLLLPLSPEALAVPAVPSAPATPASTLAPAVVAAAPRPTSARPAAAPRPTARPRVPGGPVSNLPMPALGPPPKTSIIVSDHAAIESTIAAANGIGDEDLAPANPRSTTSQPRADRVRSAPEDASPDLAPPPIEPTRKAMRKQPLTVAATPAVPIDTPSEDEAAQSQERDDREKNEARNDARDETKNTSRRQGDLEIIGLPSRMKVGQSVQVTVRWTNRSGRLWRSGSETRLVQRFIDRDSGARRRWLYDWVRTETAPNARGEQVITVTPRASGRYRLVFGILLVGPAGFTPPADRDGAAQKTWPGEVASASYNLSVSP